LGKELNTWPLMTFDRATTLSCSHYINFLKSVQTEGTNKNFFSARNTLVQRLALYTDPKSHNAQRYRRTDTHRR